MTRLCYQYAGRKERRNKGRIEERTEGINEGRKPEGRNKRRNKGPALLVFSMLEGRKE
jgi:hypothetical protein